MSDRSPDSSLPAPAHLVSPVADSFAPRSPAPRPSAITGTIALVDGMLNAKAQWGQGILDAVEAELVQRHPDARVERVARPQLGATPAEVWAAAMADRYAALVIAAGD
jgi:hypothetical protein